MSLKWNIAGFLFSKNVGPLKILYVWHDNPAATIWETKIKEWDFGFPGNSSINTLYLISIDQEAAVGEGGGGYAFLEYFSILILHENINLLYKAEPTQAFKSRKSLKMVKIISFIQGKSEFLYSQVLINLQMQRWIQLWGYFAREILVLKPVWIHYIETAILGDVIGTHRNFLSWKH